DVSTKTIDDERQPAADPHLRSAREVRGYHIEASDGSIGHVEDFLLDEQTWTIRYIIIDTRNWWPGRKVVVSPHWISAVRWADSTVAVALLRDEIKNAPEYDPSRGLTVEYAVRLDDYYARLGRKE
ncbi:MAG TPA: PRC-barrel domain-containing protein, partial [Opitutaceae bacterium]